MVLKNADIVFIAVGTPMGDDESADLQLEKGHQVVGIDNINLLIEFQTLEMEDLNH